MSRQEYRLCLCLSSLLIAGALTNWLAPVATARGEVTAIQLLGQIGPEAPESNQKADRLSEQAEDNLLAGRKEVAKSLLIEALRAYQRAGDRASEAAVLNRLGVVSRISGEYAEALAYHEQSLVIARQINKQIEVATALDNKGSVYLVQRENLDEARLLFEEALALNQDLGNHIGEADNIDHIGTLYSIYEDWPNTIDYYQQSLEISQREGYLVGESRALMNLGLAYFSQQDYERALIYYQQSLPIKEALGDRPSVAQILGALGRTYTLLARYDEALASYQQALVVDRELGNAASVSSLLNLIGLVHEGAERYDEALNFYQQSLADMQTLEDREGEAFVLTNITELLGALDRKTEAIAYYQQLLAVERRLDRTENEAVALREIGLLYANLEEHKLALDYHQQSLAIEQDLGNKEKISDALNDVAISYYYLTDYRKAIEYTHQGLTIERELGNLAGQSMLLRNLGLSYQKLENYSAAINAFEQSLTLSQSLNNSADEARVLRNIGNIYSGKEDYTQAIKVYKQSLAIRRTLNDVEQEAYMLRLLGYTYREQGSYLEALNHYQQSAELTTQAGENSFFYDINSVLSEVEEAYDFSEEADSVIPIYERAIAFYETVSTEDDFDFSRDMRKYLRPLFKLYWQQGDRKRAIDTLSRLSAISEKSFSNSFTFLSQAEPLLRLDVAVNAFQMDAAITAFLEKPTGNNTAADLSLLNVFRKKGRTLDSITISSQQYQQNESTHVSELLAELNEVNTQLANLHFQGIGDLSTEDYLAQKELLEERIRSVKADLTRSADEETYATNAIAFELTSTKEIQSLIPANAALVEFVIYQPYALEDMENRRGDFRYAAYVFTHSGDIRAVDLGEAAAIAPKIAAYRQALNTRSPRLKEAARALDAQIMAPIRPFLGDRTHLIISPDSQLNVMPFDALVDEAGRYLIESYQVSYLTSGRDLLKLKTDLPSQQPPAIIANPDYTNPAEPSADATTSIAANQRAPEAEALLFNPLPGTATEAETIAAFMPDANLLTQRQATESNLKQLRAPSILHIATHGFFLSDIVFPSAQSADSHGRSGASLSVISKESQADLSASASPSRIDNPLLRSGLALAGVNARSSGGDRILEDGIFTALEASSLNLQGTQLIVLSACETGLGDATVGDGVYGLRRAFAIAGAESQLMSLWQVDDIGTSELMQLYYENLIEKKQGRSEALRHAQLEMMNTGTYAHPYYWSSFIFSGDWRPLD